MQTQRLKFLTGKIVANSNKHFICPYAGAELKTPCSVGSCYFNLNDNPISRSFKRCFLNYQESLRYNPFAVAKKQDFDFNNLPQAQRNQIVASFFDLNEGDLGKVSANFYTSLFSILAEDALVGLRKVQLDPVPFRQCAVCGQESERLFYPRSILPSGYGYCSYPCFQLKPPPILALERNMEVDFKDLVEALEEQNTQTRTQFYRQLVDWVFGSTPIHLEPES